MKIIEKANLTMENALFGEKVFRANKTKVSNFDSEVVTDEWAENKKYTVTPTKDFISKMDITVNVPTVVYPVKGDTINIDMDGDGTAESYLVLKGTDNIVELLARTTPTGGTSIAFDSGNTNTYAGKTLDTYLNETYYAALSSTAKAAIIDKTFTQDSWYRDTSGDPDYNGLYSGTSQYQISLGSATYGAEITRHIYAISVQDIVDYLEVTPQMTSSDTTLTQASVQLLFNDSSNTIWTRSAYAADSNNSLRVTCNTGAVTNGDADSTYRARPAFTIDLSKISWS